MGLLDVSTGKNYLKIMKVEDDKGRTVARFVRKASSSDPLAVSRVNANNETVFERYHGGLKGILTDVVAKTVEFGGKKIPFWEFTINDGESEFVLSVPIRSSQARGIFYRLPNMTIGETIVIHAGWDDGGEITDERGTRTKAARIFTWITQEGKTVPQYWTKDHPNGLPELKQVEFKGELQYDDIAVIEFLYEWLEGEFRAKLNGVSVEMTTDRENLKDTLDENKAESTEDEIGQETDDDLPF